MVVNNGLLAHRVGAAAAQGANPFGPYTYVAAENTGWMFDPQMDNYKTVGVDQTLAAFLSGGTTLDQPSFQPKHPTIGRVDTAAANDPTIEHIGTDSSIKRGIHTWNLNKQEGHIGPFWSNGNWKKSNVTGSTDGTLAAHPAHLASKMQATGGQFSQFWYEGGGAYPGWGFTANYPAYASFYVKKGSTDLARFIMYDDVTPKVHIGVNFYFDGAGQISSIFVTDGDANYKRCYAQDLGLGWFRITVYCTPVSGNGGRFIFYPDFNGGNGYTYFYTFNANQESASGRCVRGETPIYYGGNPFGTILGEGTYEKNMVGWYNFGTDAGTLLLEFESQDSHDFFNGERQSIFRFVHNNTQEGIRVYLGRGDGGESRFVINVESNNVNYYAGSPAGGRNRSQNYRVAMRYGFNDYALAVDGTMLIEDTTMPSPNVGSGDFGFGTNGVGNNSGLDGFIRQAAWWPGKAENRFLEALSGQDFYTI